MKIRTFLLLVTLGVFYVFSANGQSLSVADKNLTWNSKNSIERHNNQSIDEEFNLIVKGRTNMELVIGTKQTIKFKIDSIEGSWNDEKINGELIYRLRYQSDVMGNLIISRKGKDIKAILDFREDNPHGMYHEFIISSVK